MKKQLAALAVLMMLLLVACGGSTQTSESKSMTDSLSGTYVGRNGSVLTLFPDGTSEYYYMLYSSTDDDKGAGEWSYKDGKLTWMYNGVPITAGISEYSTYTFKLEQAEGWNREQYIRASDTAEKKSASECQELIRKTLNQAEMNNFDPELNQTYNFGGVVVQIPFYWFVDDKSEEGRIFRAENFELTHASLAIQYSTALKISNSEFESSAIELWNGTSDYGENSMISYRTLEEPAIFHTGSMVGVSGVRCADLGGITIYRTVTFLYDEKSNTTLYLILKRTGDTLFKYDDDYNKIVYAVTSIETPKSLDTGNSLKVENSNGVTPELKAFLDSYEAYMDQYIAFMQKYENSNDTYAMLSDYLDMMQQYADFAEKLDQYDTDKMSAVDSAYYLEVTTRVAKKLYSAAIQ